MKNYTKDRKNLQYTKVFQRIKFIGKAGISKRKLYIILRCPYYAGVRKAEGVLVL